ncbi:hypothetical protein [Azohydromonas caseinilytica]|uniref:Uncharacterized protein n=1 Tax=Azohydromonas caseinilytica TaxID=2728836 RepID=A0A848FEV1_9BURK|nr:hypothetical protein [Azohydromonas caseinilytica]NML16869.1 hypothetical protein [Azohydromonas caseinilytica]
MNVPLSTLLEAAAWVNAAGPGEHGAWIARGDGRVLLTAEPGETSQELPPDLLDEARYLPVPDRDALAPARELALRYVRKYLPEETAAVGGLLEQPDGHARFKELLRRHNHLDAWHAYEAREFELALLEWAQDQGLKLES